MSGLNMCPICEGGPNCVFASHRRSEAKQSRVLTKWLFNPVDASATPPADATFEKATSGGNSEIASPSSNGSQRQ
jgi:hypothetical protein